MNENTGRNHAMSTHWVGADVAKSTFDAALVRGDQHYPDTPLREIPVKTFERSSQGVRTFLSWLDAHGVDDAGVRVVMEATGNYSTELAVWMLSQRQSLRPAIANPRHTSAFINATTILAELGDLRRFTLARQLSAFAGMSPQHRQSGTSIRGRSRLCKKGNARVRQCLYLSAMAAIRGNNQLRDTYRRLLAQGKLRMVALGAIMRKLLTLMRAILISGKRYQPLGITP